MSAAPPLALVTAAFCVGLWFTPIVWGGPAPDWVWGLVGGLGAVAVLPRRAGGVGRGVMAVAWVGLGALAAPVPPEAVGWPAERRVWEGEVAGPALWMGDGTRMEVLLPLGRIDLSVGVGRVEVAPGDRVRFEARVGTPLDRGNPGEASREVRAARRSIQGAAWVASAGEVAVLPGPSGDGARRLGRMRAALAGWIDQAAPAGAGLLKALVLGDRGGLTEDEEDAFARAGLTHLLSISGLHVAGVALLVQALSRVGLLRLGLGARWVSRVVSALLGVGVAGGYAVLAGLPVSAQRALVMSAVAVGASVAGYVPHPMASLVLAALVLLVVDPSALWDLGYQLSFASVAALVVSAGWTSRPAGERDEAGGWVTRSGRAALRWVGSILLTSTAATIGTAPLTLAHFHAVPLVAPLANVVGIFLIGVVTTPLAIGAAAGHLAGLPLLPEGMLWGAGQLAEAGRWVALLMGDPRRAPMLAPGLGAPGCLGLAALTGVGLALLARRRGLAGVGLAVAAGALAADPAPLRWAAPPAMTVTAYAVGQGDGIGIVLPDGRLMLVDAGGLTHGSGADPGRRIILPALLAEGHTAVDVMVLSHPHPDHLGGLLAVARAMPVRALWLAAPEPGGWARELGPPASPCGQQVLTLIDSVEASGGVVRTLRAGDPLRLGEVVVEVLHPDRAWPPPDASRAARSVNNGSLALRLLWRGRALLLAGDLEAEAEAWLVAEGAELHADVLKVPHHGSDTSTTEAFLREVAPAVALIGVGLHNRFGFPRPGVLARLADHGVAVQRSDRGAQRVVITPEGLHQRRYTTSRGWVTLGGARRGGDQKTAGRPRAEGGRWRE